MSRKSRRGRTPAPEIERIRERIIHWRRTRAKKTRMPEELWTAAVALAREHGLYATAHGLGVSYDWLKQRLYGASTRKKGPKAGSSAAFVELDAPLPFGGGWGGPRLELADSDGAKLAVSLAANEIIDIVGLDLVSHDCPTVRVEVHPQRSQPAPVQARSAGAPQTG
jgi:hypothetical protein